MTSRHAPMPSVPDDVRRLNIIDVLEPYGLRYHNGREIAAFLLSLPAASRLALSRALCPDTHVVMPKESSGTQGLRTHLSNAG